MEKINENSNIVENRTSQEKRIRSWIRRHKKVLIIVGSGVAAACGGLLLYLNRDFFEGLFSDNDKKLMGGSNQDTATCISNINGILDQDSLKTNMDIPHITEELVETVEETVDTESSKIINDGLPFLVSGGIRNLPEGWSPSQEKIEEAQNLGITLGPNQTIVDSFYKNVA